MKDEYCPVYNPSTPELSDEREARLRELKAAFGDIDIFAEIGPYQGSTDPVESYLESAVLGIGDLTGLPPRLDGRLTYVAAHSMEWASALTAFAVKSRYRIICIRGPKGTGKTTLVRDAFPTGRLVYVTDRVALVESSASKLKAEPYNLHGLDHAKKAKQARVTDRLATTVQSLHWLRERPLQHDVLVIDEIAHCLRTLAEATRDDSTGRKGGISPTTRVTLLRYLLNAVANANRVLLLDADLAPWMVMILARLAGISLDACLFIDMRNGPTRGTANEYATPGALRASFVELLDIVDQSREEGQGITLYTTSSIINAKAVFKRLEDRWGDKYRMLLVTSETRADQAQQAWFDQPQVEDEGTLYDVVVMSPVGSTGLSLDEVSEGIPAFVEVYHHGQVHDLHPDDHRQHIARVRGRPDVHYWLTKRNEKDDLLDPRTLSEELWQRYVRTADACADREDTVGSPISDRARYESLLQLHGLMAAEKRMALQAGRTGFRKKLEDDGYKVSWAPFREIEDDAKDNMKQARRDVLAQLADFMRDAPEPPGEDSYPEERDAWSLLTEGEKRLAQNAAGIRRALCIKPDDDHYGASIDWVVNGGMRKLMLAEALLAPDGEHLATQSDLAEFGYVLTEVATRTEPDPDEPGWEIVLEEERRWQQREGRLWSPVDVKHHKEQRNLVNAGLQAAGANLGDLHGEGWVYRSDTLEGFKEWCVKNKRNLKALLRITVGKRVDTRQLRTLIEAIGGEVIDEGRRGAGGQVRIRRAVVPDHVKAIIEARFQRRVERGVSTVALSKKTASVDTLDGEPDEGGAA
jgi:hypothetical protein